MAYIYHMDEKAILWVFSLVRKMEKVSGSE